MTYIEELKSRENQEVKLKGWLYNKRGSKDLYFLEVRDGTGLVQCVVGKDAVDDASWAAADDLSQEASLEVDGTVVADERQVGGVELHVTALKRIGAADDYPVTPKEHGVDFLMNNRHLWLRSRRQWAIMRVRNRVIMAIHEFYQGRGFVQMDAPILTGAAVEGTSTLFELDYFDDRAYLTQSGQLHGEAMALAMGKIYTFGPTFRAEKSKTRRHLTEFWMVEPEMAFYDLAMNMDLAEAFVEHIIQTTVRDCREELEVLERDLAPLERVKAPFPRMSYTDAVELLRSEKTSQMLEKRMKALREEQVVLQNELEENERKYGQAKKHIKRRLDAREIEIRARLDSIEEDLRYLPEWKASAREFEWGNDFGGSDETVLAWHFDRPIIVHRYPAAVKAFYMKRDPEDDKLAMGMDVLAPEGYG